MRMNKLWCLWLFMPLVSGCLAKEMPISPRSPLGCTETVECPGALVCVSGECRVNALCGNGIEEPGESCDDGDDNTEFCAYDEESCMVCNDLCELTSGLPTYCGDGIVQGDAGEACDEGDGRNGNDLCSTSCELVSWVHIEAGSFTMGSSADEVGHQSNESQREVTLTRGYYMMAHEVTQQQWEERMGYNPALHGSNDCDSCPVDSVNWWEALMYANRLSESEGYEPCYVLRGCTGATSSLSCDEAAIQGPGQEAVSSPYACEGYRLPTEAEWEYAYRAGSTTAFYSGGIQSGDTDATLDVIGWYFSNATGSTYPVMQKEPNAWDLYDMSGNVWEWVWDGYVSQESQLVDPHGVANYATRVRRGGSSENSSRHCRAAYRGNDPPHRAGVTGLRLVRTIVK